MAVKSAEEIIEKVKEFIGDRTDDAVIELLEDITDSVSSENGFTQEDIDNAVSETEQKWREKYIARFSGKVKDKEYGEEEEEEEEGEEEYIPSLDDLLKEDKKEDD